MDASEQSTRTVISVTELGRMAYESLLLERARDPAQGLAAMEVSSSRDAHPSERAVRALQLQRDAEALEQAARVVTRIVERYGLTPDQARRVGARGLRLAAEQLSAKEKEAA